MMIQLRLLDVIPTLDNTAFRTRRRHTVETYKRGARALGIDPGHKVLDYGAGFQLGTKAIRETGATVDSFEPFPDQWTGKPTYTDRKKIPSNHYDRIICQYVISAIPYNDRVELVETIGRCLKPGGIFLIVARFRADLTLDTGFAVNENEFFTGFNRYRTRSVAFTTKSLTDFVVSVLGEENFKPVKKYGISKRIGGRLTWNPWVMMQKTDLNDRASVKFERSDLNNQFDLMGPAAPKITYLE